MHICGTGGCSIGVFFYAQKEHTRCEIYYIGEEIKKMDVIYIFSKYLKPLFVGMNKKLKPNETGRINKNIYCIKDNDVNVFLYVKNKNVVIIDSGYKKSEIIKSEIANYLKGQYDTPHLFMTHLDVDHVGDLYENGYRPMGDTPVYIGEKEELHLNKVVPRMKFGPIKINTKLKINRKYQLLKDLQVVMIGDIKVEAIHTPGHTLGHMCYLIDDQYLFTGDSIALSKQKGYCFFGILNYSSKLNMKALGRLKEIALKRKCKLILTAHTGCTKDIEAAFSNVNQKIKWVI